MPDKSTSSERATQAAEATVVETAPRKIYPIVKYGDPVLEKPGAVIKEFGADLEQLT